MFSKACFGDPVLSQFSPFSIFTLYFWKIHFHIILPLTYHSWFSSPFYTLLSNVTIVIIKKDKMNGTCSIHAANKDSIENFKWKISPKERAWENMKFWRNQLCRCKIWVFTVRMIQVKVFWVVTPRSVVVGHQSFMRQSSPWTWRQQGPPKHWYSTMTLHGVTTQKTLTWSVVHVYWIEQVQDMVHRRALWL